MAFGIGANTAVFSLVNTVLVLGQRPILGRAFQAGDDHPGAPQQVILSHSLWMSRFAGDSSVVGREAVLDDTPFKIVGVMPARGDMDADLWVPVNLVAEARKVGKHGMFVIGRLKPGSTLSSATADLAIVAKRLEQQYPVDNKDHGVQVLSLNEVTVGDVAAASALSNR